MILISGGVNAQEVSPDIGGTIEWNPDGTEIAVIANNGVFIYDRDFRLLRFKDMTIANYSATAGWNPEGTRLLVGKQILDAETLEIVTETKGYPRGWISGGTQVFSISREAIHIYDASTGSQLKTMPLSIMIEDAKASPDGSKIATRVAHRMYIFDVAEGRLIGQYNQPVAIISDYIWSPDGSRIAYSAISRVEPATPGSIELEAADPPSAILYTLNMMDTASGQTLFTSSALPSDAPLLTWSGDGTRIAGLSGGPAQTAIYVWDAVSLQTLTRFSPPRSPITISYSPYGGVLAIGMSAESQQSDRTAPLLDVNMIAGTNENGFVQFVVPAPSLEQLRHLQSICAEVDEVSINLDTPRITEVLTAYTDQLDALADRSAFGCVADLLDVAEVLQK